MPRPEGATRNRFHPRSAGVCGPLRSPSGGYQGSSPLGGGLRWKPVVLIWASGLIPAGAGSANEVTSSCSLTEVHPRWRGVCVARSPTVGGLYGSSPLARGLSFGRDILYPPVGGLLPVLGSSQFLFSSPLRLGLLQEMQGGPMPDRFVPAWAGSAGNCLMEPSGWRVHPRARGVRALCVSFNTETSGSSPRLRGLLMVVCTP